MNSRQDASPHLLTINGGSSSVRLASYVAECPARCVAKWHVSSVHGQDPTVLVDFVRDNVLVAPDLVMHRVVHGGSRLTEPCLIDAVVQAEIARLTNLAPLHNPAALDWIQAARKAFGSEIPQAACFDSGFYTELPPCAATYALPKALCEQYELRRYGFHGLAHQSLLNQWHEQSRTQDIGRVISLQLGAGCSVTATDHGLPIDTSMGFSPLGGLMMATRCGDLDPSVVLHLIGSGGMSPEELSRVFNEDSGLRAVSGQSADMQALLASDTADAELAVAMFCHRVQQYIGAYLGVLGGADAILFGGGIGQNAPAIRTRILEHFSWAGIRLDPERNGSVSPDVGGPVHHDQSAVEIWVVPTDEGQVMADAAAALLKHPLPTAQSSPLETSA